MKLALISGASSGVGAACAHAFAAAGYRVLIVARSADRLEELARDIGDAAVPLACDLANPEAVGQLAARLQADFGAPDVVVHCAGAGAWKTVQETTPQEAMQMMDAPYLADFNLSAAVLPGMLARGSGTLIHVNSPACIAPWKSSAGYAAARHAVLGLHKALVQDLAGTGVQSCHVIFGQIDTPYFQINDVDRAQLPTLDRTVPTMTTAQCAEVLLQVARRPRQDTVRPRILRLYMASARMFPRLVSWMLRF